MSAAKDTLEQLYHSIESHLESLGLFQPLSSTKENSVKTIEELYAFGYQFYNSGKFSEAVDFFRVLTQIEGENPQNWIGLGASYQMQKLYNEALLAYSTATILDPTDPSILFHAANCCFELNNPTLGIKALEAAEILANQNAKYSALLPQVAILKQIWSNEENGIEFIIEGNAP